MKLTTKIFIYIGFALLTFSLFLYLRFPSDMFKSALSEQVRQIQPKAEVVTTEISPTIPPGLNIKPFYVKFDDKPMLRMDHLRITPKLMTLFSSSKRYGCSGIIGSGKLDGWIETRNVKNREQVNAKINIDQVPVSDIAFFNQWKEVKPDGDLRAEISFDNRTGGGKTNVDLDILSAVITFESPIMDVDTLDFDMIDAQLVITQRLLQIKNCDFSGDQIDGKLTGTISFIEPFDESRLSLMLTIKPNPAFIADHKNDAIGALLSSENAQKRGLIFRISGSINNPRYIIR